MVDDSSRYWREARVELRPGVELRGYAARTLWEDYRRQEEAAAPPRLPE